MFHAATTELPPPSTGPQWVRDHIVYRGHALRPKLATLQNCDTGDRVSLQSS